MAPISKKVSVNGEEIERDYGTAYAGIDPGEKGGIALLWGQTVQTWKMPATITDVWEQVEAVCGVVKRQGGMVWIEQQTPRPTVFFDKAAGKFKSSILRSTCILYANYRMLLGMLSAVGVCHAEVPPKRWQKVLSISSREKGVADTEWKNKLKGKAQQLFPATKVTLYIADALLIAEAARTQSTQQQSKLTAV